MRKKASDYRLGDRLIEVDHHDSGTIVSLTTDPTRAFILVLADDGDFTIYSCLRDALCEPRLARNIPEPVMRKFLFDVYCGGKELRHIPGVTDRIPVTIPEFKVRQPVEQPKEAEKPLPSVEYGPAPTLEPSLPLESAQPLESHLLGVRGLKPELDFP
jgi:hypothetical protein